MTGRLAVGYFFGIESKKKRPAALCHQFSLLMV